MVDKRIPVFTYKNGLKEKLMIETFYDFKIGTKGGFQWH